MSTTRYRTPAERAAGSALGSATCEDEDDLRCQREGTAGGAGGLAEVVASRGGLAAPEAPFVMEQREALIYMLCEAAELEHGIMCQYLFAASSLKQGQERGSPRRNSRRFSDGGG